MDRETAAATREGNWSRELLPKKEKASRLLADEDEKGQVERREKKLEEIAALRSETSKENGAAIDDGLMGRAAKAKKLVDCIDGNTVEDPGVTCAEACDGDCCEGDRSCEGFTGLVAKDGSCNERRACRNAKIGVVSGGSCVGEYACDGSEINEVSGGSCNGDYACQDAYIDVVSGGSCVGGSACYESIIGVVSGGSCDGG